MEEEASERTVAEGIAAEVMKSFELFRASSFEPRASLEFRDKGEENRNSMVAEIATIATLLGIFADATRRRIDPVKLQDMIVDMIDQLDLLGGTNDPNHRIVVTKNVLEIAKAMLELVQREPEHPATRILAELAYLAWHMNSQELASWAGMRLAQRERGTSTQRRIVEPKDLLAKLDELAQFGLSTPTGAAKQAEPRKISLRGRKVRVTGTFHTEGEARPLSREEIQKLVEDAGGTFTIMPREADIIIRSEENPTPVTTKEGAITVRWGEVDWAR